MGCCGKLPFRVWIGVMIFCSTFVSYSTRASQSLSITAMVQKTEHTKVPQCIRESGKFNESDPPEALHDYGPRYDWDEKIQSIILGSYFYGFVAFSLPSGAIAGWVGPYRTIIGGMSVALIFNLASPFAANLHFVGLAACRVIMGGANAVMYPSLAVLMARWAPPNEKGRWVGCLFGNMLGNAGTYFAVGYITEHLNWYYGYHFVSLLLLLYLLAYTIIVSDSPDTSRWISEEEAEYIKTAQEGKVSKVKAFPPYLSMFRSIPFWGLVIAEFGSLWGMYLQLSGVPKFLVEVIGFRMTKSGILAALPFLARMFSGVIFGHLTDWLVTSNRLTKPFIRRSFVLFSHVLPGACLCGIWAVRCNAVLIILLLSLSMGLNGSCVATHLQNHLELSPNFAGAIYSCHSFIGCTTGFICPLVTSLFIRKTNGIEEWGIVFIIGGVFYAACGMIFVVTCSTDVQPWNERKGEKTEE